MKRLFKPKLQKGSYTWLIYWLSIVQGIAFLITTPIIYNWWQYARRSSGLSSILVILLGSGLSFLVARQAVRWQGAGAWLISLISVATITIVNIVWGTGIPFYFYLIWTILTSSILLNYEGAFIFSTLALLSYLLTIFGEQQYWLPLSPLPVTGLLLGRALITILLASISGAFIWLSLQVVNRLRRENRLIFLTLGNKIQKESNQLSIHLNSQAAALQQISAAAEELLRETHRINERANETATANQILLQHLEKEMQSLRDTDQTLRLLGQELHNTNQTIIQMQDKGEVLGETATNSQQFAREIRLISLNAALETVNNRNGEGKRLQVIVAEIKQLAQRAQEVAQHSGKIAEDFQTTIGDFVVTAEVNERKVAKYIQQVEQQQQTLQALQEQAQATKKLMEEIKEAIIQQDSATHQLSNGISDIAGHANNYYQLQKNIQILADELKERAKEASSKR